MKKLKKLNLTHHADLLNDYEMKMIVGGYSTSSDGYTKCPAQSSSCSGTCTTSNNTSGTCEAVSFNGKTLCACVQD